MQVLKFGGTSVANAVNIQKVAAIVEQAIQKDRTVVVVSALGGITDTLIQSGELAAAVLVDSIGRLLPGVLNNETSALTDSFQDGLVAPPVYTRPAEYNGWKVPEVLLSGNQAKIETWKHESALKRTENRRPDLLRESDR